MKGCWYAAVASLFVILAGAAAADEAKPAPEPARMAAARELMAVTGAAKQFDAVMPLMMSQMEPLLLQMAPGHEKEIKEVMALMLDRFSKRKAELFDEISSLYSEKMSAEDMKELSRFFGTGAGARFIQMQPEIVQGSMAIGQKWGQKIGQEIQNGVREELEKRGIKI